MKTVVFNKRKTRRIKESLVARKESNFSVVPKNKLVKDILIESRFTKNPLKI